MSKVLMRRIEIWRVDSEEEAEEIISKAKSEGELTKKTVEIKQKKSKGIVVMENKKVTVQTDFAGQWEEEEEEE